MALDLTTHLRDEVHPSAPPVPQSAAPSTRTSAGDPPSREEFDSVTADIEAIKLANAELRSQLAELRVANAGLRDQLSSALSEVERLRTNSALTVSYDEVRVKAEEKFGRASNRPLSMSRIHRSSCWRLTA